MSFFRSRQSESSASRVSSDVDDTEDGEDDQDESKRRCRNLSEKKRRDQFNILIHELCLMVSGSARKMDKSTVLKGTISFLKAHNEPSIPSQAEEAGAGWKPFMLSNEEFTYLMLEALNGFIIVISDTGKVLYVSESVTSLLGHLQADFVSRTLYDFIPTEERINLYKILNNPPEDTIKRKTSVVLNIRLGGLEVGEENQTYQLVQFNGYYKRFISGDCSEQRDRSSLPNHVFVCIGKLLDSDLLREMSTVVDALSTEFTSRQSMEWKFIYLDQRAPPIIGYLPFEVLGTSGYDYIHVEDLEKLASCHEELMQKGECTSCFHRFLTKGQQWIWLKTRYHITHNQWNSKPEFIVCVNRVVSYSDVMKGRSKNSASAVTSAVCNISKRVKIEPGTGAYSLVSSIDGTDVTRRHSMHHLTYGSVVSKRSVHSRKLDLPPKFAVGTSSSFPHLHRASTSTHVAASSNEYAAHIQSVQPILPQPIRSSTPTLAVCIQPSVSPFLHPQSALSIPGSVVSVELPMLPQSDIAVALPFTAFHLHPIPNNSPSNVQVAYSTGILPTPIVHTGFQEQLLLKQAELQRHILMQQEELRLVSEQLLVSQCDVIQTEIPFLIDACGIPPILPNILESSQNPNSVSVQVQQGYSDIIQYQASTIGYTSQQHLPI